MVRFENPMRLDMEENQAFAVFASQVAESVDMGEFIPGFDFDEEEITHSIWSMVHGMAMLALTRQSYDRTDDLSTHREMLERLITGLRS